MNAYPGKRALDLIVAGSACLALAPLATGVMIAAWIDDQGPPLFRQRRVGLGRELFSVLKFRSMRNEEVTRVGQWLRGTGIDELPQFLNVLRGEMSVVGPRALTAQDVNRLQLDGPACDWRFAVKPGITGLSQLHAGGGARLSRRLERLYLRKQSVPLDLQLIVLSVAVNVLGKRRVRRWLRAAPAE